MGAFNLKKGDREMTTKNDILRETEKAKAFTEKLKTQGDVSQCEADRIYMLHHIFHFYCVSQDLTFDLQGKPIEKMKRVLRGSFPSIGKDAEDYVMSVLTDWYSTVYEYVSQGHTGNFVTTVPRINLILKTGKDTSDIQIATRRILSQEDKIFWIAGGKLEDRKETSDVQIATRRKLSQKDKIFWIASEKFEEMRPYFDSYLTSNAIPFQIRDKEVCVFARAGLFPRYRRDMNDIKFLRNATEKLKKGEDITTEEAEGIRLVVNYEQALYVESLDIIWPDERRQRKVQLENLRQEILNWFKVVHEAVKAGRKGNFLYTLPTEGGWNIGPALKYVKRTLKMLDPETHLEIAEAN